jgi:hypothetical protein
MKKNIKIFNRNKPYIRKLQNYPIYQLKFRKKRKDGKGSFGNYITNVNEPKIKKEKKLITKKFDAIISGLKNIIDTNRNNSQNNAQNNLRTELMNDFRNFLTINKPNTMEDYRQDNIGNNYDQNIHYNNIDNNQDRYFDNFYNKSNDQISMDELLYHDKPLFTADDFAQNDYAEDNYWDDAALNGKTKKLKIIDENEKKILEKQKDIEKKINKKDTIENSFEFLRETGQVPHHFENIINNVREMDPDDVLKFVENTSKKNIASWGMLYNLQDKYEDHVIEMKEILPPDYKGDRTSSIKDRDYRKIVDNMNKKFEFLNLVNKLFIGSMSNEAEKYKIFEKANLNDIMNKYNIQEKGYNFDKKEIKIATTLLFGDDNDFKKPLNEIALKKLRQDTKLLSNIIDEESNNVQKLEKQIQKNKIKKKKFMEIENFVPKKKTNNDFNKNNFVYYEDKNEDSPYIKNLKKEYKKYSSNLNKYDKKIKIIKDDLDDIIGEEQG